MMKNLVFDVDGTLYPASDGVEDESENLCVKFFEEKLNFSHKEALKKIEQMRQKYHYEAEGMAETFGVSQEEYLEYVCATKAEKVHPNSELEQLLRTMPYRKFILTDATRSHALDILKKLQVNSSNFEKIFEAKDGNFAYKYRDEMFEKFFEICQVIPEETIFFDDKQNCLKQAKKFGMKTVLITEKSTEKTDNVDLIFSKINDALKAICSITENASSITGKL